MTITLDSSWIADVSRDVYSVSVLDASGNTVTTGTITPTRYLRYLAMINTRLLKDGLLNSDGSLKTSCEYLAAYLICDLIQKSPVTDGGIKSETFGDYTYSKTDASANSNKSAFMINYETELALRKRGSTVSTGVIRSDKNIEFAKLSQGLPPEIGGSDEL